MPSKFKDILKSLEIDETYSKSEKKDKHFTKVKQNIPLIPDYNFASDLLFLPTTTQGYKYALVVVDLATDEFDIEPLKNKEPKTVLAAFKSMFKRPHIKKPYASVRTDAGNEFKGVFAKYLYDESILHSVAKPGRHTQLANVESLNKQLGRLFNGYMNKMEEETGAAYRNWTDILGAVRTKLNAYRKKTYPADAPYTHNYQFPIILNNKNKYKVGDMVYIKLDQPQDALGNRVHGTFRAGDMRWDRIPRKITHMFYYAGHKSTTYRYLVSDIKNATFSESQLKPAKEKEQKWVVRSIIGKRKVRNKIEYLVWWKGFPKNEATYEPAESLKKQIPKLIADYEKSISSKR